ncbi:MAG: HEPN domain-containing protein [bacterium]|nr:HEPN domain-containing protein [bacterium]
MNASLDEARQLFGAGSRDRTSFHLLVESARAPHETVGFLAQQACEKFIKVVLVLHGVPLERTHDLEYLAELATAAGRHKTARYNCTLAPTQPLCRGFAL